MRTTPLLTAAVISLSVSIAACSSDDDDGPTTPTPTAPPTTAGVEASGSSNAFLPPQVTIARTGTVTWTFAARPHNVVFAATAGAPANVVTTTNGAASRAFTTAGTFAYECTVHPGMSGSVVVR